MDKQIEEKIQSFNSEKGSTSIAKTARQVVAVFLLLAVSSCGLFDKKQEVVLARVGDKLLTEADIQVRMPAGLNHSDSLQFTEDYIKSWVKQELILQKAEENLTNEQKDVTRELNEYKNSLLIYRYKNALVSQKLDTVVTNEQIDNYYSDFKQRFVLQNHIVKAIYIKVPKEMANQTKLLKMCEQYHADESELQTFSYQYAKKFDYFNHQWTNFYEVIQNTPFIIDDQNKFLKQKKYIDRTDDSYYYLLYIEDFRLKGDISPIDFVQDRIKSLILNKRKLNFLRNLEDEVYREGLKHSKFKIFNQ
ncbi:hypothetical protein EMN47_08960 [Prolixibacteraceae bacterium JC049]|nr:hypothetical protein [Prolixibacteraceae bacterium JC049]